MSNFNFQILTNGRDRYIRIEDVANWLLAEATIEDARADMQRLIDQPVQKR